MTKLFPPRSLRPTNNCYSNKITTATQLLSSIPHMPPAEVLLAACVSVRVCICVFMFMLCLSHAVHAHSHHCCRDAMIELECACDGGKDSLSMAAAAGGETVMAPGNLVVSAYVGCPDVTKVRVSTTERVVLLLSRGWWD